MYWPTESKSIGQYRSANIYRINRDKQKIRQLYTTGSVKIAWEGVAGNKTLLG
jgi:hypothetical protein